MSSPLPAVQVLVGFNNGQYDDPATITSIASPAGTLGGHNVWTDISAFVPDIETGRGRQHELGQFEAGTLTLTGVNNSDGRFNPWNTSSPYAGKIVPMVPVQVRAVVNLLSALDASFEGTLGTWTAGANTAAASSTAQAEDGAHSMALTASALGNVSASTATGTSGYAVTAGTVYSALASFRAFSTGRAWTVGISWYTSAGALISTSTGSSVTDTSTGWTVGTISAPAPATAAFATVVVTGTSLAASETHYVDEVGLYQAGGAPPWSPGGFGAYPLFTGHINSWAPKWGDVVSQFIDIQAADAFRLLAGADLASLAYQNQVATDGAAHLWPCADAVGSSSAVDGIGGSAGTVVNSRDNLTGQPLLCSFSGPGSGPLLAQSSGYFSTGPFYSDIQPGATFTGNYLQLPGVNSSGPFSVEMDLQVPSGQFTGGFQPFVAGQNVSNSSSWWTWELLAAPFRLQCIVNNSGGTSTILAVNYPTDGKWHKVQMAYTSSALVIYIDGVQAGSVVGNGYPTLTSGQVATVGNLQNTSGLAGGLNIANVAFYNSTALSLAQAQNHFSLGIGLGGPNYGTVDAQIKQALAIVGWPSTAEDILPAIQQAQNNTTSIISTTALSVLQQLERTEEGALFMSGAGKVTFRDRTTLAGANANYPQYAQPQVYFGDDVANPATMGTWGTGTWGNSTWATSSARYDPGQDMALDDLDIVDQAVVTRVGGIAQIATNTTAHSKSLSVSNVLHLSDAASLAHANWILARESTAVFRLRSLTTNLIDALGEDTVANTPGAGQTYSRVGQLLGLDLMYRVRTDRWSVGFEQDAVVEHIQHKITTNSWDITLALSTTDTYPNWSWGGAQ